MHRQSWNKDCRVVLTALHRMGYSKKGYIDGEISVEWLKDFEAKTRVKAAGRRRLLLLDGHASHYSTAFLLYAKAHRIEVLGYPSAGAFAQYTRLSGSRRRDFR